MRQPATFPPAALLLLLLAASACLRPALEPLDFFEVVLDAPRLISLDTLRLSGRVERLDAGRAEAVGFVWSTEKAEVEADAAVLAVFPGVLAGTFLAGSGDAFLSDFTGLEAEKTVYLRAFAQKGGRRVFSKNMEFFTPGRIVAGTADAPRVSNDTAWARGKIIGIEALKMEVAGHGHVWSASNPLPTLGGPGCDSSNFFRRNDDYVFESTLPGLGFHQKYHVRAWAAGASGPPVYGPTVDTFWTGGGWKKTALEFPGDWLTDGSAIFLPQTGRVLAGFGCTDVTCLESNLPRDFWELDLPDGIWAARRDLPPSAFFRTNACLFALGDTVYHIFGEQNTASGKDFVVDFWKYAPETGQWRSGPDPFDMQNRSGAVAFTLGGKGYAGTGISHNNLYLSDFWEYDPATGQWREMAPLPLLTAPGGVPQPKGRAEATAFGIGPHGYVGGGDSGGQPLRDFWRFTPPPAGPQGKGLWEPMSEFFPGDDRLRAASFCLGPRGYLGTGHSLASEFRRLNDFWEFDPARSPAWRRQKDFPGGRRESALGFSIGTAGMLGTGLERRPVAGGTQAEEVRHRDFWLFVPE